MSKVDLIRPVVFLVLAIACPLPSFAQPSKPVNLIRNGDFERHDMGFSSDYRYDESGSPGTYVVTADASYNNPDFKTPVNGDHTKGRGFYLVCNMDGQAGKKIWCGNAKVLPNTLYEFSAYFCNVYAKLPPKTNFAFEGGDVKGNDPEVRVMIGKEVIAVEKDFYHLFRWIRITGTWYSDGRNSQVQICIDNLNHSISGNDLALDDISFTYLQTMPDGYQPPKRTVTVVDRYYVAPKDSVAKKIPLNTYGEFEWNDTVAPGVYVLHPKPWHPIEVEPLPTTKKDSVIERIELHSLSFDQTKAELKESAKAELDLVAQWMQRDQNVRIRFIGHTDNQGDPLLNVKLSEERVLNVKKYLIQKGIAEDRIETVGYGGAYPIADNKTEESRRLNRRVEMEILSK